MQRSSAHRLATLAFMVVVTAWLLALVFEKAATAGPATAAEVLVYALTAAFGLEFLIVCWPGSATGGGRRSQHGQGV